MVTIIIIMSCHYCKCNKYSDTFYLSVTNENGVIISCKVTLIKSRQEFIVESCVFTFPNGRREMVEKLRSLKLLKKCFKILISFTQSRNNLTMLNNDKQLTDIFLGLIY